MKKGLLCTAAAGFLVAAATAQAQVNYSVAEAEVVLTRAFIEDAANNFPAGNYRFYIAADQDTGTLYAVADQGVSPFTQGLVSIDISGATIGAPTRA